MGIDSLQVAVAAEQVALQRVASLIGLVGQLHVARFADVAVDMEVLIHGDDANGLLGVGVGVLHGSDA